MSNIKSIVLYKTVSKYLNILASMDDMLFLELGYQSELNFLYYVVRLSPIVLTHGL